mgnify:CR=1 FL=1|jgi:hypothetical protein
MFFCCTKEDEALFKALRDERILASSWNGQWCVSPLGGNTTNMCFFKTYNELRNYCLSIYHEIAG